MAGNETNAGARRYLGALRAEADLVIVTVRDKGAQRFGKAFGLSAFLVMAAYAGVYKPPQKKIARLTRQIDAARAVSEAGARYLDLRGQLAETYQALPRLQDRQQWLWNGMIDSLRANGLASDSYQPVSEMESKGLIFQTSTVQLTAKFGDIYAWLMRVESAEPLMHVSRLSVTKKGDRLGWNGVSASVMTAIPKKRFD
ncbi:MAG: hypothetical protein HY403_01525 [Elusimicrobia bacterium]|nr:hypothetical protein [Elusimicrobiota bacterium]